MTWYKEFLNGEIDGLEPLLALFESKDEFMRYFFSHIKFFKPNIVEKHSTILLERIEKGDSIPVRYSMKTKELFYYKNEVTNSGTSKKSFKNRSDAQEFAKSTDLYHRVTDIKVCIDKDGNDFVRKEIFKATGYKVSQGAMSDIKNYMISHIWEYTENPLFFTSLWNITLIPHFIAFILDKPDKDGLIGEIKDISKAICFRIYNPTNLISKYNLKIDETNFNKYNTLIDSYIQENIIKFIEPNLSTIDKQYIEIELQNPFNA